jgi:putative aldouronate transport system permease protein
VSTRSDVEQRGADPGSRAELRREAASESIPTADAGQELASGAAASVGPSPGVGPAVAAAEVGPSRGHRSGRGERPRAPRRSLRRRIWRERSMYAFILPGLLFFLVFAYLPMLGNVVAFQDFSPFRGIAGSEWVGLEHFRTIVVDPEIRQALFNTVIIAVLQLVFAFPAPILLALLLNSLLSEATRRFVQTVVYLPHFLSWVIVISIWTQVVGGDGLVATLLNVVGVDGFNAMGNASTFKILVVAQSVWKDVGWGTIIFFAAIAGIPRELYEAAAADGADGWRRTWHVTLPALVPVTTLLLILNLGNFLTVGFEQMLLQQPNVGPRAAQVLDTFVYFRGVAGGQWGLATAAGLVKGVIGTVMVIGANRITKKLGGQGIF